MENITAEDLVRVNVGQEPSFVFKSMPSIYSRADNGTEFGYGYYYIRGLDQTRINVTLDGMPWNEAEDFGTYFANSPDLMASIHSAKVERGTSSKTIGVSASAGNINLESVDLKKDTTSYVQAVYGSFNTYKTSAVYNMGLKKGFGLHIKATTSHTDGYRQNSFNTSHALTAKLGYYINNNHVIDVMSINGYHTNSQGWIGSTAETLANDARANGNTKNETDNWIQSINKIQYRGWLSDNTLLTSSLYLQYQTGSYRFDLDNYMLNVECFPTTTGIVYDYGLTHYLYGGNVAVKSVFEHFDVYGGVNVYGFQREHFMDNRNAKYTTNVDPSEYYDNFGYKLDASVFVGGAWKYNGFTLGANVQYRHSAFSYYDKLENRRFSSGDLKTFWNFINGGIDLSYDINKHHRVYTKLSVSNREPMRSDMFGGNETLSPDTIAKYGLATTTPELVHDVELGWEGNGSFYKANINLFYMYFKNELILNGEYSVNGLPLHENATSSYRTGVEVSFDIEPVKGLHLVNGTSYSYGKVNSATYINKTHVYFPSWTLNQDVHYDMSFGDVGVTVGASYDFRSKIFIDLHNTHWLPNNMSLNTYATLTLKNRVEFGIRLNNITNHINYSYGTVNAAGEVLYVQEAKFNCLGSMKFYF
jgi:iron complex outermembrane receptor protein